MGLVSLGVVVFNLDARNTSLKTEPWLFCAGILLSISPLPGYVSRHAEEELLKQVDVSA